MQLKIVNKTGFGYDTQVVVMDGDKEIGRLLCVRSIDFDWITSQSLITAKLDCYINHIELLAEPKRQTLPFLQWIHNKQEMERLGLGRIN